MKKFIIILLLFVSTIIFADWTVVQTYTIPGKASGLAWDGTHLYSGIYGSDGSNIYQIDPTNGSYQLQFSDPVLEDTYGLTYDGSNLWLTDHRNGAYEPAVAYKYDMNGNILTEFELADHYMSGITYDAGDFWVATYYPDDPSVLYKVDDTGTILSQIDFDIPGNDEEQPWDLCMENGNLWVADYYADALYKFDPSNGTILESHDCENIKPSGIVYDGNYLWYVDGPLNSDATLYKVDLGGTGTPVISLPWEEFDFGNTIIGQPEMVNLPITNTGTAPLEINEMLFLEDEFYSDATLPLTIPEGSTEDVAIYFDPSEIGQFNAILTIGSNDPVNPSEQIDLMGYGVSEDPQIVIDPTSLNYGNIRVNASSSKIIDLSNQGSGNLTISDISTDIPEYYLDSSVELPIDLATTENYELRVWFSPSSVATFDGTLTIECNDPTALINEIPLEGSGEDIQLPIGQTIWQHQITTGYDNSPKAIAKISDVTGDGKNDVIITSEDNYVRCFNGNSSSTADIIWETEIYSGNIFGQNGLIIVDDIDGDDYQDVIVGTSGGDRSVRCLSGKTGMIFFTYNTNQYGEGGTVYQVNASQDFNEDGINDVVASTGDDSFGTGPKRVFLFDGSNGDVIWDFHTVGTKFSCIGVNDVNNDGTPDVIAGASDGSETTGLVYAIDGENATQLWQFTAGGSSVWALETIDDANYDGVDDIVAGDFSGNIYALDATNGATIWTASAGSCIILRFEKMDDVNNDGHPDIAIAHSTNSNTLLIDGFTGSTIWQHSVADQPWCIDRIGDVSGDGINDLIVGTLFQNNYGYFLDGVDGSELSVINIGSPVDAIGGILDVTDDGSWEMVVGGRDGTVMCISGGLNTSGQSDDTIPNVNFAAELIGNFPNPFNPDTAIKFDLKQNSKVRLEIYNIKGQLVKTLLEENLPASSYTANWNGKDTNNNSVSSGIYFYKLSAGKFSEIKKCTLIK